MKQSLVLVLLLLTVLTSLSVWGQDSSGTSKLPETNNAVGETTADDTVSTLNAVSTGASMLPDISVIGNIKGTLANHGIDAETNQHIQLDEVEVVMGSKIYPGIRADLVIAGGATDPVGVEEAYLTAEELISNIPVGARLGVKRLPFGKVNPVHPHSLPFVDTPSAITNLIGNEFRGNGFEIVSLIPTHSAFFLQAQLGRWENLGDPMEGAGFHDEKAFTLGRLWTGTSLPGDAEIEIGTSGAFGKGAFDTTNNINLNDVSIIGGDITFRKWLPGERRLLLQGEYINRKQDVSKEGYYLLGTYRPNHQYEFGSRYDWSEIISSTSHESYVSLFATKFLSETTYMRLQVKKGVDGSGQKVNELLAQFVFGFGPHTHALQ